MAKKESLTPLGRIEHLIQLIRDHRVILDADLARLYGVATKALNQAVKRNRKRFPPDFMFRLTEEEKNEVVTACDHLSRLRFSPVLPCAFTEHGAIMLANVLNSERAVKASVQVVRAFVRLREVLASNRGWCTSWQSWNGVPPRTTSKSRPFSRPSASFSIRPNHPGRRSVFACETAAPRTESSAGEVTGDTGTTRRDYLHVPERRGPLARMAPHPFGEALYFRVREFINGGLGA